MTGRGRQGASINGALRLTWVTDHLAHVIDTSTDGETSGIWTGLACPDHGLQIGSDVDNAILLSLAGHGLIADLIWEAPRRTRPALHGRDPRLSIWQRRRRRAPLAARHGPVVPGLVS